MFSIEPPKPIDRFIYLCDNKFHPEFIEELYQNQTAYGLIWITGENTLFYRIEGTLVNKLDNRSTRIANRQKKGGQSAPRFQRIRNGEIHRYVSDMAEYARKYYTDLDGLPNLPVIYLVGNGDKKDLLYKDLIPKLKEITEIRRIDDKITLHELITKLVPSVKSINYQEESKILSEFKKEIDLDRGKAIYGHSVVAKKLKNGRLKYIIADKTLLDTKGVDLKKFEIKCTQYGCQLIIFNEHHSILTNFGGIVALSYY